MRSISMYRRALLPLFGVSTQLRKIWQSSRQTSPSSVEPQRRESSTVPSVPPGGSSGIRILHVTDASAAGVLSAVTTLSREQACSPDNHEVSLAYVLRRETPPQTVIEQMVTPRVRVSCWSHSVGVMRIVALIRNLASELRSGHYDIVHLHSSRTGFIGRFVGAFLGCGATIVYSPHGFAFAQPAHAGGKRAVYLALEWVGSLFGSNIVLVSDSELAICRAAFPRAKLAVLPNAVDHNILQRRPLRSVADGESRKRRIVHVGRITEAKAPGLFIHATAALTDLALADGRLVISAAWLGDGDRSLLADAPITVSGWLSADELRRWLIQADLVLFTSRCEGMPVALLEAQAMGIPIVGSQVPGVIDVIDHGKTGYVGTSAAELAEYAYRILCDDTLHEQMSATARRRSAEYFDVTSLAAKSFAIYRYLRSSVAATPQRRTMVPAEIGGY